MPSSLTLEDFLICERIGQSILGRRALTIYRAAHSQDVYTMHMWHLYPCRYLHIKRYLTTRGGGTTHA
jgi:hypothetical protein